MTRVTIVLVGNEPQVRRILDMAMTQDSYRLLEVSSLAAVEECLRGERPDLLLLSQTVEQQSGLQWLKGQEWFVRSEDRPEVILLFTEAGRDELLDALRMGIAWFWETPDSRLESIRQVLTRALHQRRLSQVSVVVDVMSHTANGVQGDDIELDENHGLNGIQKPQEWLNIADLSRLPLAEARAIFEEAYLQRVLNNVHGNVRNAAELAGIARQHMYRRITDYGLKLSEYRAGELRVSTNGDA